MVNSRYKTKCDFCKYHTASGCNAKPDSWYCREAQQELYEWIESKKINKSIRYKRK